MFKKIIERTEGDFIDISNTPGKYLNFLPKEQESFS